MEFDDENVVFITNKEGVSIMLSRTLRKKRIESEIRESNNSPIFKTIVKKRDIEATNEIYY